MWRVMQLDRDVVTRKKNFGTAITIGFIDYFIALRPRIAQPGNSELLLSSIPESRGSAGLSRSQAERPHARSDPQESTSRSMISMMQGRENEGELSC